MVIRRGLPVDFSDDEEWITVTGDGVKREPPAPMGPLRVVDVPPRVTQHTEDIMAERLDGKFQGTITKNKNGEVVPPDEFMVFLAKDNAFPATLRFYQEECIRQGAKMEQLQAVLEAIARLDKWRAANPHRLKTPDVDPLEIDVG